MMPIVSSVIVEVNVQRDGRRWVRERHIDHVAVQYTRNYLTTAIADIDAALAAYAVQLVIDLREAEISNNVNDVMVNGSLATPTFVYSTQLQNFAGLRAEYQTAVRVEAVMTGDFLSTLTNGQLQTAFGFTAGQVTTLRANKLTPAAALAADIRASTGQ